MCLLVNSWGRTSARGAPAMTPGRQHGCDVLWVAMFYGWLDIVRNIFEITYVSSKIGPLKSNLDGNKEYRGP